MAYVKKTKTHCKHGHALADNVNTRGECKTCVRTSMQRLRRKANPQKKYADYRTLDSIGKKEALQQKQPKKKPERTAAERERIEREQREIDRACDARFNMAQPIRILKPGMPEFDEVAKTVTPLEKIKATEFVMYANLSFEAVYANA